MGTLLAAANLTDVDLWVLVCFQNLERHYKRSPSLRELAAYTSRAISTVHISLTRLAMAGQLAHDPKSRRYSSSG